MALPIRLAHDVGIDPRGEENIEQPAPAKDTRLHEYVGRKVNVMIGEQLARLGFRQLGYLLRGNLLDGVQGALIRDGSGKARLADFLRPRIG